MVNVQVAPRIGWKIMSVVLVGSLIICCPKPTAAQTQAPPSPESAADRTKRQADNPYKWIIMQDDKPRVKGAPKPPPAVERDKKPAVAQAPERTARAAATTAITPTITPTTSSSPKPIVAAPATTAPASLSAPASPPVETSNPTTALAPPPAVVKLPEPQIPDVLNLLVQVPPEITREVVSRGIRQGRVKVKFKVMPDGSVADTEVVTSTNRALNSLVVAAVSKWKYAPIKQTQEHGAEVAFNLDQ